MIVLGVGDYGVSVKEDGVLKTFALGSCVAVMLYDPRKRVGGMVHVALPDSSTNTKRAQALPGYFADSGIPLLLQKVAEARGDDSVRGLVVKICGGASVVKGHNIFDIGKRNIEAVKKVLREHRLRPMREDVAGSISRTVSMEIATGKVVLNSPGRGEWEL